MSPSDRILIAAGAGSLVLAATAAWLLVGPSPTPGDPLAIASSGPDASAVAAPSDGTLSTEIVVDVQGAVEQPGIHRLPAGARVADAIAAAGGYGLTIDLDAAAALNLARTLDDGEQVRVPARGEVAAQPSDAEGTAPDLAGGAATGGLVDLNTATPEALEALPGIGPVTVQKIVAARTERPFSSLEEAVERGVLHRGQLEDIRELATAG